MQNESKIKFIFSLRKVTYVIRAKITSANFALVENSQLNLDYHRVYLNSQHYLTFLYNNAFIYLSQFNLNIKHKSRK